MESPPQGEWKSESRQTICENPWFSVLLQSVRRPDGTKVPYYTLDFPSPAVGVIVRQAGRFLLIRQHRFIVNQYVWAIPSGGIHAGESAEQAAIREVHEETGYRINNLRHLLYYYPSYGCSNQRFELFLAEELEDVSAPFDANEVMEVRWFTREEVLELIANNGIVDGLSLTPLAVLLLQEATARNSDSMQRAGSIPASR